LYQKRKHYNNGVFLYYSSQETFTPKINAVIGVQYKISNSLFFGVEIVPAISYTTGTQKHDTEKGNIKNWNIGFNNNSARLSLIYRFK